MPDYPDLQQIAGTVTRPPEARYVTVKGGQSLVTNFSLLVPLRYGPGDDNSRFVTVSVWNEQLGARVQEEVYKGAKIVAEGGPVKERNYNGKTYYDFSALRIGLLTWISRDGKTPAVKQEPPDDPDELPF